MKDLLSQLAGRITGTTTNVRPVIAPLFSRDAGIAPLSPLTNAGASGRAARHREPHGWLVTRRLDAAGATADEGHDVRTAAGNGSASLTSTAADEAVRRQSGRTPHDADRLDDLPRRADHLHRDHRANHLVESSSPSSSFPSSAPVGAPRDAAVRGAHMSDSSRDRRNDRDDVHGHRDDRDHPSSERHAAIADAIDARRRSASIHPRLVADAALTDPAGAGRRLGDLRPRADAIDPAHGLPGPVLAQLRALGESVAALEAAAAQPVAPQIHVTIGRIDVRSQAAAIVAAAPHVPDRAPASPAITLAQYLDRRREFTP